MTWAAVTVLLAGQALWIQHGLRELRAALDDLLGGHLDRIEDRLAGLEAVLREHGERLEVS